MPPFACPRCGSEVCERFWGPCQTCRTELTTLMQRTAEHVESERFEPVLHVVPNHVATRD